jgi:hypothetical protein
MDLKEFLKKTELNWDKVIAVPDGGTALDYEFEIEPEDFLRFAEIDSNNIEKHSLVNGLSNAKRAIDCATEKVFRIFELTPVKNNFPLKLRLLQDIGVVAPRIINKVNQTRNLLEHEFKIPTRENVEDAIDIANLFVSSIRGVLSSVWTDFYLQENDDESESLIGTIYFSFDPTKKEWKVSVSNPDSNFTIKSNAKQYNSILKILLNFGKNPSKQAEGIKELIA